jgi:hypothetical protein
MVRPAAEPPKRLPPEVLTQIAVNDRHKLRWVGRIGGFTYLSVSLYLPLFLLVGVRDWTWVIAFHGFCLAASALSFATAFRRDPPDWMVLGVMLPRPRH